MLKKRIIPCLDVEGNRTVKGTHFVNIIDAGDPLKLAQCYAQEGADELIFLDITATIEKRKLFIEMVSKIAALINIPFTVGGGMRSIADVGAVIHAGADKVSINSAAVEHPSLITQIARRHGSQCAVVAIDTKLVDGKWTVVTHGGRVVTPLETLNWAKQVEKLQAGEILLTSMEHDGDQKGFAMDITQQVSNAVNIPVIASGGAGKKEHFVHLFRETRASAALAASIFHFGKIGIGELKTYLKTENVPVR